MQDETRYQDAVLRVVNDLSEGIFRAPHP